MEQAVCSKCEYKSAVVEKNAGAAAVNHEMQTGHKCKLVKVVPFSPYALACELKYTEMRSGINWTWVTFADEETRQKFDAECRKHGYRVRDYGECKTQYHHYED